MHQHKPTPGLHLILVNSPKYCHCIQESLFERRLSKIFKKSNLNFVLKPFFMEPITKSQRALKLPTSPISGCEICSEIFLLQ